MLFTLNIALIVVSSIKFRELLVYGSEVNSLGRAEDLVQICSKCIKFSGKGGISLIGNKAVLKSKKKKTL